MIVGMGIMVTEEGAEVHLIHLTQTMDLRETRTRKYPRGIFRLRMIKFLGGFVDPKTDDKPKVKEADTIKIPAFPLAETYRNWRIKTREAAGAASTDPDSAFKWVSESWKEDQTIEALRKVAPFATLDAKLLSALTNIISGDFARNVDTFKEDRSHCWTDCQGTTSVAYAP